MPRLARLIRPLILSLLAVSTLALAAEPARPRIGLVLGVDRFLDMCRTTLNVTGDLVAATVVSRGESDDDIPADAREPVAPEI